MAFINQDTQQSVPCDTYWDSDQSPLNYVLCVLAQLIIIVQWKYVLFFPLERADHACMILEANYGEFKICVLTQIKQEINSFDLLINC